MNYLINPLWIYLLDVLRDVETMLCITILFAFCAAFISILCFVICKANGYDNEDDVYNVSKKVAKISTIIVIITGIIIGLIPSQKTMYTMFVASYVTEENIDATGDAVTDMIDYIFEKVDELQDSDESDDSGSEE